jgi:hypothetical protein
MYGYGRVYRSMMGPRHFSLLKNCRKFNIENKNIEKYAFFKKTIFLQKKNISTTIHLPKVSKKA